MRDIIKAINESVEPKKQAKKNLKEAFYEASFEDIPLVDRFDFKNTRTNMLSGIRNIKELLKL